MFKKVIFSVIAFAIGAMVSVSIQACADDYDGISISGSSNNSLCNCSAWDLDKVESCVIYDEQGRKINEYKNTFNKHGWLEKQVNTSYSGAIKNGETIRTYTYSSSGDVRYGTTVSNFYDTSGQLILTQRSTDEYRLRK